MIFPNVCSGYFVPVMPSLKWQQREKEVGRPDGRFDNVKMFEQVSACQSNKTTFSK
jgi:hypothetical protein